MPTHQRRLKIRWPSLFDHFMLLAISSEFALMKLKIWPNMSSENKIIPYKVIGKNCVLQRSRAKHKYFPD